ncbi:hypothetical protein BsWGS_23733 [Bradybaena similaris]
MEILDVHKQQMLLDLIEQGAPWLAMELLKGDNNFSKDDLNKSLTSACQQGYTPIVQMLVQLGANVNYRDTNGNTPLMVSVQNGLADIVQFLLTNKADVNASNSVGDSALILSIRPSGSTKITEILLKQPGINIDHQNQDGYTAIMKAAEVKNVDALKLLLDKYFSFDYKTNPAPHFLHIDEHKTYECISNCVCGCVPQWTTLENTVNSKGENVHQIAKSCEIGSVFQILQEHVSTRISPLYLAIRANDIKSFNIFLNCDFLYAPKRKICLDEVFLHIFETCSNKDIIQFNENEIAMIKALLEHGADVNITWLDHTPMFDREQADSYTPSRISPTPVSLQKSLYCKRQMDPIQIAAKSGSVEVLELLLSFRVDVNRYDYPNSPFHIALTHDHKEFAKLLIQHVANMDIKQALMLAVEQQEPKYVRFLTEFYQNEVRKKFKVISGIQDVLLCSVRKGNLEIIGQILDLGANINDVVDSGMCPLAESKNGEVAKFLINRGANVNSVNFREQKLNDAPLIKVLVNRNSADNSVMEVIQVLLENGASANGVCWYGASVKDKSLCGKTALMLAAMKEGSMNVLQLLLSHGADLGERDGKGNTALAHAVIKDCFYNVLFLLRFIKDRKGILNLQNNEGLTALMYAVRFMNLTIAKELLDHGADVNIKDKHGNTLLLRQLIILKGRSFNIMKFLIPAGCDVNCQNNDGLSPLMVAAQNHLEEVMCVLLDSGAEVNAVSMKDKTKTALSHLVYISPLHDYFSCLEYLLDRGANASYLEATALHRMIITDKIHVVLKLIRCGLGPVSVLADGMLLCNGMDIAVRAHRIPSLTCITDTTFDCSPLCTALCVGDSALARIFVGNLFLTNSDVSLLGHNKLLRHHLAQLNSEDCLDILNEISTQPMTLLNLSFVAVSTAVGAAPGRETRVNKLPVPQMIKDKLLFKKFDATYNAKEKGTTTLIPRSYSASAMRTLDSLQAKLRKGNEYTLTRSQDPLFEKELILEYYY